MKNELVSQLLCQLISSPEYLRIVSKLGICKIYFKSCAKDNVDLKLSSSFYCISCKSKRALFERSIYRWLNKRYFLIGVSSIYRWLTKNVHSFKFRICFCMVNIFQRKDGRYILLSRNLSLGNIAPCASSLHFKIKDKQRFLYFKVCAFLETQLNIRQDVLVDNKTMSIGS